MIFFLTSPLFGIQLWYLRSVFFFFLKLASQRSFEWTAPFRADFLTWFSWNSQINWTHDTTHIQRDFFCKNLIARKLDISQIYFELTMYRLTVNPSLILQAESLHSIQTWPSKGKTSVVDYLWQILQYCFTMKKKSFASFLGVHKNSFSRWDLDLPHLKIEPVFIFSYTRHPTTCESWPCPLPGVSSGDVVRHVWPWMHKQGFRTWPLDFDHWWQKCSDKPGLIGQ